MSDQGELAALIDHIMKHPSATKQLRDDRIAYWDDATGTVVFYDPHNRDYGTAFRPRDGKQYFERERELERDSDLLPRGMNG